MAKSKFKYKTNNRMKAFGVTDFDKHLITINKRLAKARGTTGELLDSIVHETMHARHPRAKEKTVQKMAERTTKRLSKKSKRAYYGKLK